MIAKPGGAGQADLIHEFAFPLPIYAICDLLGVPREDQDDFRDWAGMMLRHTKAGHGGGPRGGVAKSVKKMRGYLAELIHRKRASLGDTAEADEDLISALIRASDHGEHLTENEAAAMAFILLFAGFETTVNLIGNGLYALLRHLPSGSCSRSRSRRATPSCSPPASRNCSATTAPWSWRPGGSRPRS